VRGRRILVLGAAYKANTGDARETPAVPIITQLLGLGATVRVADPHVAPDHLPPEVERVSADRGEVSAADVVVVLVQHDEFDLGMVAECADYVFDTRRCLRAGPNVDVL
jgi:UDP-N-acetyl-D-mannosaminuronate dehydrogenase